MYNCFSYLVCFLKSRGYASFSLLWPSLLKEFVHVYHCPLWRTAERISVPAGFFFVPFGSTMRNRLFPYSLRLYLRPVERNAVDLHLFFINSTVNHPPYKFVTRRRQVQPTKIQMTYNGAVVERDIPGYKYFSDQ
jgi:hypothetical protein